MFQARARHMSTKTQCSCLNWMHVYRAGLADCGQGLELTTKQRKIGPSQSHLSKGKSCDSHSVKAENACKSQTPAFYPMQDHYYCLKTHSEKNSEPEKDHSNWCYVSTQCKDLRGGKKLNNETSWKYCKPGAESSLGDLAPIELFALAYQLNTRFGCEWSQIGKMYPLMAYPWGDPKDYPHNATVGEAGKFNTLAVHWENQLWEIQNEPVCLQGC